MSVTVFCSFSAYADNAFVALVKQTEVTEKEVQDALTQLEKYKKIELKQNLSISPFHHQNEIDVDAKKKTKQPFCQVCHLQKPHQANQRNRSFLNMHTDYISCETCHLKTKNIKLDYHWLAFSFPNTGEMIYVANSPHYKVVKATASIIPRPGVRISPFMQGQPVLTFKDSDFSKDVEQKWKNLRTEEKAKLKAELHKPLNQKGVRCSGCHSEKESILNLELLGANVKESHGITSNTIANFFKRYKKDSDQFKMSDLLR